MVKASISNKRKEFVKLVHNTLWIQNEVKQGILKHAAIIEIKYSVPFITWYKLYSTVTSRKALPSFVQLVVIWRERSTYVGIGTRVLTILVSSCRSRIACVYCFLTQAAFRYLIFLISLDEPTYETIRRNLEINYDYGGLILTGNHGFENMLKAIDFTFCENYANCEPPPIKAFLKTNINKKVRKSLWFNCKFSLSFHKWTVILNSIVSTLSTLWQD